MLSIGKIGGGHGDPRYYIDSVAKGQEDYYTGHGEAEGEWHGAGAAAIGLSGTVGDDEFIAALSIDPAGRRKVLGFDLTFSAPKSVSLLYGIGDPSTARLARDAHDEAVKQALGYLERNACFTRRRDGRERLKGDGLTVALFRHRTSRAGDPQLHTHAVVANTTRAGEFTGALDGRALYAHARTAGFLYQAALRHEVTRTIGVDWEPVHNGLAEIRGFDRDTLRAFSRRSEEIRNRLSTLGYRSPHAAELATLETRRLKTYDVPVDRLREEWRARASELGLGRDELHAILDRRAPGKPITPDQAIVADQLSAPGGVTREASTFDRRDVLRDWAQAHREGTTVNRLESLTDEWLSSSAAIRLEPGDSRRPGGPRYSTPEVLRLETRLIEEARARKNEGIGLADESTVEVAIAGRPTLSDEQVELVRRITRSGDGLQIVRAPAGSGKTFALATARDAWEASGTRVYGCAVAARAAVELESLAGIDSTTVSQLRTDIEHGYGLPRGSVLIVDEAGMAGTRAITELAEHTAEMHAKLVLVGDDRQLPELDAGGAFRGLAERLGAVELRAIRRQQDEWDRDALLALRAGKIDEWNEAYREHGRIVARPTAQAMRQAIVDDWWRAAREATGDSVMIAHRRADVAELNCLARARMHEDGRLSDNELESGGRAFAVGDRVIARHNDRRLGVVNGARGTVTALHKERRAIEVQLDNGRDIEIDLAYLEDGHLDHGYAITAHAAQGATVDQAFVLGSDDLYREWGYTALTRHRDEARFYIVSPGSTERCLPGLEPETDPIAEQLRDMLGHSRRKEMATEIIERSRGEIPSPAPIDGAAHETHGPAALIAAEFRTDVPVLGVEHARGILCDPPAAVTRRIGSRPPGLHDRDMWVKAAHHLLQLPDALDPLPAPDVGIELDDIALDL